MKKIKRMAAIVIMMGAALLMSACGRKKVSGGAVIGGADGPTAILVAGNLPGGELQPPEGAVYADGEPDFSSIEGEGWKVEVINNVETIVSLDGNATTGYDWYITGEADCAVCDNDTYTPNAETGKVGGGGVHEFHIIPAAEGEGTIEFTYMRSWEGGEKGSKAVLKLSVEKADDASFRFGNVQMEMRK